MPLIINLGSISAPVVSVLLPVLHLNQKQAKSHTLFSNNEKSDMLFEMLVKDNDVYRQQIAKQKLAPSTKPLLYMHMSIST